MKKAYSAIAIDIDEVLVETAPGVIRHYNSKYGTNVRLKDYYSDDFNHWRVPDFATAVQRVNEFADTEEYMQLPPVKHSIRVIQDLAKSYHLYVITGRPDFISEVTKIWLEKHFPNLFKRVIFSNFYDPDKQRSKGEICVELGIDLLIDDHPAHVLSVAKLGIDGYLFGDFPWAKMPGKLPANVKRVKDWQEVAELLL